MISAEALTAELNNRGLHFIAGNTSPKETSTLSPGVLLAGLAEQGDARLRLAIIALLLYHPELARSIPDALALLGKHEQINLKLFYTAAVLLQQKYSQQLQRHVRDWQPLPDLFSAELGLPTLGSPDTRLQALGEHHRQASNLAANWVGTYQYAVTRLLKRLEKEATWTT